MAEDLGERTEEATPRRRQQAREEGNVPRSHDLSGALLLLAGTLALSMTLTPIMGAFRDMMATVLGAPGLAGPMDPNSARASAMNAAGTALAAAGPVIVIIWVAALLSQIGQIGWLFSPHILAPKFGKLNPVAGFQRIASLSSLVKVSLDSLKVLIVVVVGVTAVMQYSHEILLLPYLAALQTAGRVGWMLLDLALRTLAVLLLLGVLDLLYQRWKYRRDLRMSKAQVKDELKQMEGDPDMKRRRIRMQQQIAMQRISSAVPKADVVVTNPEHVAVAIQYDAGRMHAPKVIAKGADFLALRIRQLAIRHGIPIVERKPLARALYGQVRVGQEIPPDFYQAVAEILAYVYRLSGRMAG